MGYPGALRFAARIEELNRLNLLVPSDKRLHFVAISPIDGKPEGSPVPIPERVYVTSLGKRYEPEIVKDRLESVAFTVLGAILGAALTKLVELL